VKNPEVNATGNRHLVSVTWSCWVRHADGTHVEGELDASPRYAGPRVLGVPWSYCEQEVPHTVMAHAGCLVAIPAERS